MFQQDSQSCDRNETTGGDTRGSPTSERKDWNQVKGDVAPWWGENSKEAYASGLANLSTALKNWDDSRKGKRRGRRVGFPRFKSKHRSTPSVRFTTGTIRVEPDRRHVTLPRLGRIKTHESTRKLARRLEVGTARILSATVRLEAGRWFCSFTCEVQRAEHTPARPDAVIGVDLGVKTLAVFSDGTTVANPRHYDAGARKLRRLSQAAPPVAGGVPQAGPGPQDGPEAVEAVAARQHRPQPGTSPGGEPAAR